MMPKLSGFEVCKKLKHDPATRGIMILMVTAARTSWATLNQAVDSGRENDFLKPEAGEQGPSCSNASRTCSSCGT